MKRVQLHTLMPLGWLVFALGFLAFSLTMETTAMIGDTRGYDPGGKAVPVAASAAMAVLSLWQLVRERKRQAGQETFAAPVWLIIGYIAVSAAYIGLFRTLGYMLSTCLLIFWLTMFNLHASGIGPGWNKAFGWMAGTLAYLVISYSCMRLCIRSLFRLARAHALPWLREPAVQALAGALAMAIIVMVVGWGLKRWQVRHAIRIAVQSSISTTLAVYIAFRLLFLVQLPAGVMNW